MCLERLKKRKVTLKQCEATVWSGSEFAEHCFVFSNLSFFLVFPVYRTRSLHQSLNVCLSVSFQRHLISTLSKEELYLRSRRTGCSIEWFPFLKRIYFNKISRRRRSFFSKQKTENMNFEKFHVRRMVQGRRRMWSMLAHTWKTMDCVKERIDSCLSGSEFVNPFFVLSSLLFFLVWTVCVTLSRRSCTILLTSGFLK